MYLNEETKKVIWADEQKLVFSVYNRLFYWSMFLFVGKFDFYFQLFAWIAWFQLDISNPVSFFPDESAMVHG
jgi:hypothetical protein